MNPNKSKYNIRGWLTDINDTNQLQQTGQPVDLFAFRINYSDPVAGYFQSSGADVQPLFNGNIAETYWRSASDNTLRGYGYSYDELNRLKNAYYRKPNTVTPLPQTFDEYLAYDLNGNITGLQRYSGNDTPGSAQLTDELDYTYFTDSNRLKEVSDNSGSPKGFDDGNTTGDDYAYDANGSMTMDKNKGITSISYNHLNLPVEIIWSGTKKIEYLYNAAGVKVRKKVNDGTNITITDYLDGFQYNEQVLEFFPTTEGYVKATPTGLVPPGTPPSTYAFNYVFNYTDHLGNVRVSYTKDPQTGNLKILDESHYYPFGLKHQEYSTFGFVSNPIQGVIIAPIANNPYKYKYNGKELQDELGLNMYDMDMRQYDPAIARWVVMDPVIHHSVSPYSAFDNNPVFWADPSGADSEFFSAFPDQNIAHYGTSNTIDIANIIEANQKMENTMQMIKALIKLAENYGGKNSKSGGEPNNGDPKQVLKNDSDHTIYFKPEGNMTVDGKEYKNGGAYPLEPGGKWEHGFDGVAAPHISEGSIFKASNGVSVTVSDKSITWSGGPIDSQIMMYAGNIFSGSDYTGGWKTESWLKDLTASSVTTTTTSWKTGASNQSTTIKKSDKSWINLFDKAGLKNAQDYHQSHTINRRAGGF